MAPHAPAAEAVTLVQLLTQGGSGEAAHNMAPYLPGHAVKRCARINIQWFFPQGCSSRELRAVLQHPRDGGAALRANAARPAAPPAAAAAPTSRTSRPRNPRRMAIGKRSYRVRGGRASWKTATGFPLSRKARNDLRRAHYHKENGAQRQRDYRAAKRKRKADADAARARARLSRMRALAAESVAARARTAPSSALALALAAAAATRKARRDKCSEQLASINGGLHILARKGKYWERGLQKVS